jgi:hypothetical protein
LLRVVYLMKAVPEVGGDGVECPANEVVDEF